MNRAERKLYNKIYHKRRAEQNIAKGYLIPCGCGCGERISSVDGYGNSHSFRRGHNHRGRHYKKVNRICLICRSSKTYISRTKFGTPYQQWHRYQDGWLCTGCYDRFRYTKNLKNRHNSIMKKTARTEYAIEGAW